MAILKRALLIAVLVLAAFAVPAAGQSGSTRIADLVVHDGDVPRRLVGYGLVVGLPGTGDRSFGGTLSHSPTVHSVVNLLRRFEVEVPPEYLRVRNVAAVLVTAEVSPYLRAGARFEVTVSALGDATSLEGGALWITPLVTDPDQPPVATAQGTLLLPRDSNERTTWFRPMNSGRIPDGGILEVDPELATASESRLLLRHPDRVTARRIADAINAAFGDSSAAVLDPGAVRLQPPSAGSGDFLADVDLLTVDVDAPARVIIHGATGTVVAGGDVTVGPAVIQHLGLTLRIGGDPAAAPASSRNLVQLAARPLVQDVVAGLHAAGARPGEIGVILEALRDAGALSAEVVIR